jgi:hypothetical protein
MIMTNKNAFLKGLNNTLLNSEYNMSRTENGALGYKTSGKALVDFNFKISSYRNTSEDLIVKDFDKVYFENPNLAMVFLYFIGDVRGGLGERRLFRILLRHIVQDLGDNRILNTLKYIGEYTRWDNIFSVFGISYEVDNCVMEVVRNQLDRDLTEMFNDGKNVSLLAKWMPSINTSSKKTVTLARVIAKEHLHMTEETYRKTLSSLRKYLDITEVKTCGNNWEEINYDKVPSKANIKYKEAFLKHDEMRRSLYLDSVKKGEAKMNASTLFPYEIIKRYNVPGSHFYTSSEESGIDDTLELAWKNLPNYLEGSDASVMVITDVSGSMTVDVGGITAYEVAESLAMYFAERLIGSYKDKAILFSSKPVYIDFSKCNSLYNKIRLYNEYNDYSNTDLYKVYKLILDTAIENKLSQEELPNTLLILSDMEFDSAIDFTVNDDHWGDMRVNLSRYPHHFHVKLFDIIKDMYANAGYKLPKLVFWNIYSRTNTIPVIENELGVTLVSGFSASIAKMVLSDKLDPFEVIMEQLDNKRYDQIREAIALPPVI